MPKNSNHEQLTDFEKRVVKALLNEGWSGQDVLAKINFARASSINSGRISAIKANVNIQPAAPQELARFLLSKETFDPKTGLNVVDHERLIRASG